MAELKILNARESRELLQSIEEQWGAKIKMDCGFLKNNKNRVFIVSKDISRIETSRLRLNSVGMYFCETDRHGIRLSIEGAQIVGQESSKNTVEVDEDLARKWLTGDDLELQCKDCSGFVILKLKKPHSKDFDYLGCGKYRDGKVLNYVGKSRRIYQ